MFQFNPVKSSGECQSWTLLDEPEKSNSTLAAMLSPQARVGVLPVPDTARAP